MNLMVAAVLVLIINTGPHPVPTLFHEGDSSITQAIGFSTMENCEVYGDSLTTGKDILYACIPVDTVKAFSDAQQ